MASETHECPLANVVISKPCQVYTCIYNSRNKEFAFNCAAHLLMLEEPSISTIAKLKRVPEELVKKKSCAAAERISQVIMLYHLETFVVQNVLNHGSAYDWQQRFLWVEEQVLKISRDRSKRKQKPYSRVIKHYLELIRLMQNLLDHPVYHYPESRWDITLAIVTVLDERVYQGFTESNFGRKAPPLNKILVQKKSVLKNIRKIFNQIESVILTLS